MVKLGAGVKNKRESTELAVQLHIIAFNQSITVSGSSDCVYRGIQ